MASSTSATSGSHDHHDGATSSSQRPVIVTAASTLTSGAATGSQTAGMLRQDALVNVADGICATRMVGQPGTQSAVHHHGAQDTIVYAISGVGAVVTDGGRTKKVLRPGDFALIPAWVEHAERNESEDEDVVWCIVRSGREPCVVNLEGWSDPGM